MRNFIVAGVLGMASTLTASAQFQQQQQQQQFGNPYNGNSMPFMQNYYNRNTQPLSPYLNLLRGGNPAVNYFYGVRPGLMQGAFGSPLAGNMSQLGRQTFFPQVDNLYDLENVGPSDGIRPTGHPIGFNNTLNYYGAGTSGYGMMGQRGNQQRASLQAPRPSTGVR